MHYSIIFLIAILAVVSEQDIKALVRGCLELASENQKTGAARIGKSDSQFSRILEHGGPNLLQIATLGPRFVKPLLPLLAAMVGLEPIHYDERKSA